MNVKSRKQPVVPKIGVWYHRKEKSLYGGDHRVFYLCTQINEQNPNKVMLYYCKKGIIKTVWAERDELREAFWLVTNRFHQFCLLLCSVIDIARRHLLQASNVMIPKISRLRKFVLGPESCTIK